MSDLQLKNHTPDENGLIHRVTPASAGWSYVGFELYRLQPGQTMTRAADDREVCVVLIGGRISATTDDATFKDIGERDGPFDGKKPYSVYVPAGIGLSVTAQTGVELALCSGPGGGGFVTRLITPDDITYTKRGEATNTRHVYDILPETEPAHSLLVVEVITPSGCWSSYPSHKHDTDDLPNESQLEETYYHRLNPAQGFAFQRVYTDDQSLDETMCVHDGDLVMVPRGYHPVGTAHGYDLYYLNVMAGPKRVWKINTEDAHRWLLAP
ncbi:MAG: 5-deoxy-glucuronate isomerase [Alphaproteobacteria bacterium]|nr:5-deoxy-glucuronate isomerase [Alphaproteobacteria bacterium]MCZ6587784.1 5-deoxy-glucuronate isomerase [Alphaproteobacteria bacterium]MCZ6591544.1 5-deoxy-glucuronate isomerase [Alphaproteobacteria bacterium]MCZ6839552.1 5-deoxy-glucuronate isomerase [Alphaproteobacteria bacterium]MCZ6844926.1 5-deoxy-glucuronate isomerase [Alphaproteobacteria bacterium]